MGLTAVDSGVLIGLFDGSDPFHTSAKIALLEAIEDGRVLIPGVAYAESLMSVLRAGGSTTGYDLILSKLSIEVGTCSKEVLALGATMRAAGLADKRGRQWHLPDALIVAEAIKSGAETIVTTDQSWPAFQDGPRVKVLRPTRS